MKKIILILKGTLLLITVTTTVLLISGIDYLMRNDYFTIFFIGWALTCILNFLLVTEEDMTKMLPKWLIDFMKEDE